MQSSWMFCVILLSTTCKIQVRSTIWGRHDSSYDEYGSISSEYDEYETSSNKDNATYCPQLFSELAQFEDRWTYARHITCSYITSDTIVASVKEVNSKSFYVPIRSMTISNSHLKKLTNGTFYGVKYLEHLYFRNTTIETIEPSAFMGLKTLKRLFLNGTNIQTLSEGSFNGLLDLKELVLSSNNFNSKLNRKIFSNLSLLTNLNLDGNLVTNIDPTTFQDMENLKHLSLRQNLLKKLDRKLLQFSKNITHLKLSHNIIMEIEDQALPSQLKVLDISFNNLTVLRPEMFANLSRNMSLTELNVSYNNLNFTSFLSNFQHLENLLLNHNAVEEFSDLPIWSNINLSSNKIRKISNLTFVLGAEHFDISHNSLVAFDKLRGSHLQNLFMNNNNLSGQIENGKFSELPKLRALRLDFNKITSFSNGSFDGLGLLELLNISFNSLNDLNPAIFNPLKNLQVLYINGNHLKTLDIQSINRNALSLRSIGISHNHWTCESLTNILNYLQDSSITIIHHSIRYIFKPHVIHCINDKLTTEKSKNDKEQEITTEVAIISTEQSTHPASTEKENKPEVNRDKQQMTQSSTTPPNVANNESNKIIVGKPSESISGLKITIIVLAVAACCGLSYILYISYRKKIRQHSNPNTRSYQAMEAEELL